MGTTTRQQIHELQALVQELSHKVARLEAEKANQDWIDWRDTPKEYGPKPRYWTHPIPGGFAMVDEMVERDKRMMAELEAQQGQEWTSVEATVSGSVNNSNN